MALLIAVILLHWIIVWRVGAYEISDPWGYTALTTFAAMGLAGFLVVSGIVEVARSIRRRGHRLGIAIVYLSLVPAVVGALWLLGPVLRAAWVRDAAFRRDIGARSQVWAMDILSRPRPEVIQGRPDDNLLPTVREDLVPGYLRNRRVVIRDPAEADGLVRGANLPHLMVLYGGGHTGKAGYLIGPSDLTIQPSASKPYGALRVHRIMPGVYRFVGQP